MFSFVLNLLGVLFVLGVVACVVLEFHNNVDKDGDTLVSCSNNFSNYSWEDCIKLIEEGDYDVYYVGRLVDVKKVNFDALFKDNWSWVVNEDRKEIYLNPKKGYSCTLPIEY